VASLTNMEIHIQWRKESPDINAFKKWAFENPEEVRKNMERSRELYEKSLTEKKKAEETTGTANTSNNNSKLP